MSYHGRQETRPGCICKSTDCARLISKQDVKDINSWAGLRNHAAWDEVSDKKRVSLMLAGVEPVYAQIRRIGSFSVSCFLVKALCDTRRFFHLENLPHYLFFPLVAVQGRRSDCRPSTRLRSLQAGLRGARYLFQGGG